MDWKGILLEVGGAVAAPYTGGASLIAANAINAARANNAAKNTVVDQTTANQNVNQQVRDTSVARLQPGANIGNSALRTLAGLYGLPDPGMMSQPAPADAGGDAAATPPAGRVRPPDTPSLGQATQRTLASFASDSPQTVAQQQTQSSYVKMRSPDGQEEDVPPELVPHYLKLGAQQVQTQVPA
jgi:hypothetical protein